MKLQKRLAALMMAACLTLTMAVTAYAHEAVDLDRTGSITVTMKYNGALVPGGELTLYRVAEVREDDGNYSFALTEEFEESGVSVDLENMGDSALANTASTLSSYVTKEGLSGETVTIGRNGTVTADNLALGLYLVVQNKPAEGYHAASPFLVSVPMNEDGSYVYDVDATPKVGILTESTPDKPTTPTDPTLPQTGQLNWPVPVMTALGLGLLLLGMALRFGQKGKPYEA